MRCVGEVKVSLRALVCGWGLVGWLLSPTAAQVVINEIHYEPEVKASREEFVEVVNHGDDVVDLSGWFFSEGIAYRFPEGTEMAPGALLVVAQDPAAILRSFGTPALGPFVGRLDNQGERVVLRDREARIRDEVDYGVGFPWPAASTGRRSSMELVHPTLDNDLGGSWRASGVSDSPPPGRAFLLEEGSVWQYRKATSEPQQGWRQSGFVPDASWLEGPAPIGFGPRLEPATELTDMRENYAGVYLRRTLTVAGELPHALKLRLLVDDGAVVWINGVEVFRQNVAEDAELAFESLARRATIRPGEVTETLAVPSGYLVEGENVISAHVMNIRLSSNDFFADFALFVPGFEDGEVLSFPSPGARNTAFSTSVPPQLRQVRHEPQAPLTGEPLLVTVKATDPDGVARVELLYQVVPPGEFLPAFLPLTSSEIATQPDRLLPVNPAFEDPVNWAVLPMRDDGGGADEVAGDSIYSVRLPPQEHRTLLRYRIRATDSVGTSLRVPVRDDGTLNFAAFFYDGVPPYVAAQNSVHPDGAGHVYESELLASLPVYHLLTRAEDMRQCLAYDPRFQIPKSNEMGRDKFNWEGAFVYRGKVYDHVRYRLRQANDRYGGTGKRSMRIRFHEGNYLQAHDNSARPYRTRWRTLNIGKGFDNKRVGNFGLTETANAILWNMMGVPAPHFHSFHFRVIDGAAEVPEENGQYFGDFWGLFVATENYDPRFLEAHDLEDGNLYKLKDGQFNGNDFKRNQGMDAVTTDEDFQNIRRNLRPQRDAMWLSEHVNYDRWYAYHAVVEGIRHYDFVPADSHSKNRAWYFEPSANPLGRLWTLPHDSDASWGPNWNGGVDYSKNAIFADEGKVAFRREYRNAIREFRDLIWTRETLESLIDGLAEFVQDFAHADRDRWRGAPPEAGRQDFGAIENKIEDMKRFAFTGWEGPTGPSVPAGGRALHLDNLAAAEGGSDRPPLTPVVSALGPDDFPLDALQFGVSPFEDPTGDAFSRLQWRLGDVTPDEPGDSVSRSPRRLECPAIWTLEVEDASTEVLVPRTVVAAGRTYRLRARYRNGEGYESHWSDPIEFTVEASRQESTVSRDLKVTEVHYHPPADSGFEFLELYNAGGEVLDLTGVTLRGGVEFSFSTPPEPLLPGAYAVLVRDRAVFETVHGAGGLRVLGEYRGRLSNGGETLEVLHGSELVVAFEYDDAWYPSTDGEGYSLVLRDARAVERDLSSPEAWRPSREPGGSPGRVDETLPAGRQLPSDATQDGALDLADALALIEILFGDAPTELPCGDGTLTTAANRQLVDFNADGRLNLVDAVRLLDYLFRRGAAPALGTECVERASCADACAEA